VVQAALKCKGKQQLLFLLAVCERLKARLGGVAESLIARWQPVAIALGNHLGLDHSQTAIFGEEVPPQLCKCNSAYAQGVAVQSKSIVASTSTKDSDF